MTQNQILLRAQQDLQPKAGMYSRDVGTYHNQQGQGFYFLSSPWASKPSMESMYLLLKYVSSASIHLYHTQTYWPVCTHVHTSRYTPYTYACTHVYSCVHTQPLINASCYFSVGWKRKVKVKVTQSYPTLCDPMDYTVHGILQARIMEWVALPFSRGPSQPRDQTQVSCIAGRFFTSWATREAQEYWSGKPNPSPADLPDPGIEPGPPALQADSLPAEADDTPKPSWCKLWHAHWQILMTRKGKT